MTVRSLSLPEELEVKLEEAFAAWHARKVQVLIEDDDVPENHELALSLEELEAFLNSLDVPTKVIVDMDVYRVKLREKVPYEEYKKILEGLRGLSWAQWDSKSRAILVKRTREKPVEDEQLEVEEIVVAPKEVKA
ncbi:hypothetical protein E3E35_08065 [Thermococcus sp. GR7]|uniref:hypothetical protein n=1 Tax=unclassified Thermococcus TaxID=2627626 RepID=UPI0014322970|nr:MULTISPECIES: hypothetical protein [unclassified Thermococcus]NJE47353.1 hypothetical protein [Thermococcus sp. GR7]NJE78848.1 hypothetical protein [Thermococcus sp. GR4]NJF23157.1 hypothetical protein [Thermococcus sp. GR5]